MTISQSLLFRLFCTAFIAGILLSFSYDLLYALRLWLLPQNMRYTLPAIQKIVCKRDQKSTKGKWHAYRVMLFCEDIFFCLIAAFILILLLFWLNNGAFRAMAPLGMIIGFWLCHISFSKVLRAALQWCAFCIETVIYYLLKPLKTWMGCVRKACINIYRIQHNKHLYQKRQRYTKQERLQIDRAVQVLLPIIYKQKHRAERSRTCKIKQQKNNLA